MSEDPVFIGGVGRSGTTLVADMLGLHPRLSPIYETDLVLVLPRLFLRYGERSFDEVSTAVFLYMDNWTKSLPLRPHNKQPYERYHHGAHYIRFDRLFALRRTAELLRDMEEGCTIDGFRRFLIALFEEHCRRDGKPRWINKTPRYVLHLPLLRSLFPTMRFIHCIRDGRDVACFSVIRPLGPDNFPEAAVWWASRVAKGVEFGQDHPDQYLEVRYEDLVRHPDDSLRRMLEWLGEDGNPEDILRHYRQGPVQLNPSGAGVWERRFSPEDRQVFWKIAGRWLEYFCYGA